MSRGLLAHVPTEQEMQRLYYELAREQAPAVGEKKRWAYRPSSLEELIGLAGEMLRYDARLLTILLHLFLRRWSDINPFVLRQVMSGMKWPQALLVVFEFCRLMADDSEFRLMLEYLSAGWPRVEPIERFFLEAEKPGSRMAARREGLNLSAYERWGFIGVERPSADLVTKRTIGRYDAATRRKIAKQIAQEPQGFSLSEYLRAIDYGVSRQQALTDLKKATHLKRKGHGRGARWVQATTPKQNEKQK